MLILSFNFINVICMRLSVGKDREVDGGLLDGETEVKKGCNRTTIS